MKMSEIRTKNQKFKIAIFFLLAVFLLGGILAFKYYSDRENKDEIVKSKLYDSRNSSVEAEAPINVSEEKDVPAKETIPEKFIIKGVPFAVQAPLGEWDDIHEEACEEASIMMLEYFKKGKNISAETAEKEIQALVAHQSKTKGDYKDSTIHEVAELAKDYYGLDLEEVYDFKKDDLKRYLSQGRPIIIPAAGRLLGNPYFTPPGPLYHNLVLTGYDGDVMIANDPGTKRGMNYRYDIDTLYGAIHDFPGNKEDILEGKRAILVLK